jgi:hypothetical protein
MRDFKKGLGRCSEEVSTILRVCRISTVKGYLQMKMLNFGESYYKMSQ